MRRDEVPKLVDVLRRMEEHAIQSDARSGALLWAMARLCYGLRKDGVLNDSAIEDAFDPSQATQSFHEKMRTTVFETIRDLRDWSLGKTESRQ